MRYKRKKKGAVYTLDATFSILLTIIAITSINGYFNRISYNKFLQAQPTEIGADAINMLHRGRMLESFYLENEYFFNNTVMDVYRTNHGTFEDNAHLETEYKDYYQHFLTLDGVDDYLKITNTGDFDFGESTDFTFSLWVKTTDDGALISKGGVSDEDIYLKIDTGGIIEGSIGGSTVTSNGFPVTDNQWHHVVWSVNRDGQQKIYIDNNVKESISTTSHDNSNTYNLLIGAYNNSATITANLNCQLDDIQIFKKALGTTEINKLFNKESLTGPSSNLVAKYSFDPKVNTINNSINDHFPRQYGMIIQLEDDQGVIIANGAQPDITSIANFIATGERIIAIKDSNKIKNIIKVRYYAWTR